MDVFVLKEPLKHSNRRLQCPIIARKISLPFTIPYFFPPKGWNTTQNGCRSLILEALGAPREAMGKPEHNADTAIGTSWSNGAHTDRADWAGKKLRFTEHVPHTNSRPWPTWSHSILTNTLPDRYCSPTLQMRMWRRDKSKYSNVRSELTGEPRLEPPLSSTSCRLRENRKYLLLWPFLLFIVSPPP